MFFLFLVLTTGLLAQENNPIVLNHADELEVVYRDGRYHTYVVGNVDFTTENGHIYCDSAIYLKQNYFDLRGNVVIDDEDYLLHADSVYYDLPKKMATARGEHVELWSYADSLYASGVFARYSRDSGYFWMENRPVVYLRYPDTANMIQVVSDYFEHNSKNSITQASGNVIISSEEMNAEAGCAVMKLSGGMLDLYDNPVVRRKKSELKGEFIALTFADDELTQIVVSDSARGEFTEPVDSLEIFFNKSILSGDYIKLSFVDNQLNAVLCRGQAYSWFNPSSQGGRQFEQNTVSGDTIQFAVLNDELQSVTIIGGGVGEFIRGERIKEDIPKIESSIADSTSKPVIIGTDSTATADTLAVVHDTTAVASVRKVDTVSYKSERIVYDLTDSVITLSNHAEVTSGNMSLRAEKVIFDTDARMVEAFSAEIDTAKTTKTEIDKNSFGSLQPSAIPVVLRDGETELLGDYLEYSIDTEKGRIVQSKTSFQDGYHYGSRLFREQKDVFYIESASFTTCDKAEPHFNFHSSRIKLMEGNKMIAKPVVFYLGRIPLMAIPYYVFPLKKGRHSGFLPFTFGRFEQSERYIRNIGYYWAASKYWDMTTALDYYEQSRTFTFRNRLNFNKRYVLDGFINVEYRSRTNFNSAVAEEFSNHDWQMSGAYNHYISPSFEIRATGSFVSSSTYYTDVSSNLDERLNRELVSRINFKKKFGKDITLSGSASHSQNLDKESRTDLLPDMTLSLPPIFPFGSGATDENGRRVQKWYNGFVFRYRPALKNFSSRITVDSVFVNGDTVFTYDSLGVLIDTLLSADTLSFRSRKGYTKVQHNPSLSLPAIRLGNYLNLIPGFGYSETWFMIHETDQSLAAGIDASTNYRTYSYNAGISANTKLYGTIYPNIFGLVGLRHVLNPSVRYSWSPEIDRHPLVRSFAGGGAGGQKSSALSFSMTNTLQAKVNNGGIEKNLELLSVTTSFSYNFLAEDKPYSDISTSLRSGAIPNLSLTLTTRHSVYDPNNGDLSFFSPYLQSLRFDASLRLHGDRFLFDDASIVGLHGVDSLSQIRQAPDSFGSTVGSSSGRKGWNLTVAYGHSETGRAENWRRTRFIRTTLGFNLTPKTTVSYSQYYDVERGRTISSSVRVVRQIHCWIGSLYWVPVGSNQGFGFELRVAASALKDIKIDNNFSSFSTTSLNR